MHNKSLCNKTGVAYQKINRLSYGSNFLWVLLCLGLSPLGIMAQNLGYCDDPTFFYYDGDGDGDGDGNQNYNESEKEFLQGKFNAFLLGKDYIFSSDGLLMYGCIDVAKESSLDEFVSNSNDCNDNDPQIHSRTVWYLDSDGDGTGGSTEFTGCSPPSSSYKLTTGDACDNDDTATSFYTWYYDADGDKFAGSSITTEACTAPDRYYAKADDCNDDNPFIHPKTVWYLDSDGDGWGGDEIQQGCLQPTGYVSNTLDYDDGDTCITNIYPQTYYEDYDGDGEGDPNTTARCSTPPYSNGHYYVTNNRDCNDNNRLVHSSTVWYRDSDGDGFGHLNSTKTQCSQPSGYVLNHSDIDDTNDKKTFRQSYDDYGQIAENSRVGSYVYAQKSRYALDSVVLSGPGVHYYKRHPGQRVDYNMDRKAVKVVEQGQGTAYFRYNHNHQRHHAFFESMEPVTIEEPSKEKKEVVPLEKEFPYQKRSFKKHYSTIFPAEITISGESGTASFVDFVGGDAYSAPVAIINDKAHYLHRDHLGSILAISDSNGKVIEERHFSPWGKMDWFKVNGEEADFKDSILPRGYTGHEHFEGIALIHMNGRMYDPQLRRFLSPDNHIQDPYNTMSYDRMGYVWNNPLMASDPSGEEAITLYGIFKAALQIYSFFKLSQSINNAIENKASFVEIGSAVLLNVVSILIGTQIDNSLLSSAATTKGGQFFRGAMRGFVKNSTAAVIGAGVQGKDLGQFWASGLEGALYGGVSEINRPLPQVYPEGTYDQWRRDGYLAQQAEHQEWLARRWQSYQYGGWAKPMGLDSPFFVPSFLGKAFSLGSTAARGSTTGFRYMTQAELQAVQKTGLLRGGRSGETFLTRDVFKSGLKAQQRLALPTKPTLRVEFEILNNPTLLRNGTKVHPAFGMSGRGAEFMTTSPVRVNLINWQPLR